MNPRSLVLAVALAAAASPCAIAQAQVATDASRSPDSAGARPLPADLVVPIHTLPADPTFGAYGVWAGGLRYKVRFSDSVTFFPRLGRSAPRNRSLTWRTVAARIGDHVLADATTGGAGRAASAVRYEYDRGPVVEAYDVRPDGVEQTFVLATRPAARGDLVVEGRLESDLQAPPAADRHADLDFVDPRTGLAVARYGRAFALDATGRKTPICTTHDGGRVRLCVPSAFLADAVFPVTIDPLTTPVLMNIDNYLHADMGAHRRSIAGQTHLFAYSLYTSATDIDMVVFSHGPDWLSTYQLFADVSDSWHTNHPAIAYCGGSADRWIVAFERQNTASQIRLYLHGRDDTGFNTGQLVFMSRMASDAHDWKPDVGGLLNSSLALVVCQSEQGAQFNPTALSNVFGRIVDVATGQMASAPLPLASSVSPGYEREGPTVNTHGLPGVTHWQTAWSQRPALLGKFEVHTAQVATDATVRPAVRVDDPAQDFHKVLAKVDGNEDQFLVTYTLADGLGQEYGRFLHGTRFRNVNGQIADVRHRSVATAGASETVVNTSLAFDLDTQSHWGLGWHTASVGGSVPRVAFVARVGFGGGITEQQALSPSVGQASWRPMLAFSRTGFAVGYCHSSGPLARHFVYPSTAGITEIGPGCGNAYLTTRLPYAGNANYTVLMTAAAAGGISVPLLSFGRASVPLAFLGMSGCVLHLDPASLIALPGTPTLPFGIALMALPLPDTFFGDLYHQWWFTDPAAPGGARVSPALQIRVR